MKCSQTRLKWIAVCFMTLDHIGVYCGALPAVAPWYGLLRVLGRIAAPIFLFCMVESLRHTRSRLRLLGRLAFWNAVTALLSTAADVLFFAPRGTVPEIPGMLMTFFCMGVLVMLADGFRTAVKTRDLRRLGVPAAVCAGLAVCYAVQPMLRDALPDRTAQALFDALAPRPFSVDYTPVFLLMGLAWYFVRGRRAQAGMLLAFTLLCTAGTALGVTRMTGFFNETQRWMFLALPFLLCYDGTRGRGMGRFFYLYYPLHILALAALAACAADFTKILPSA